MQGSVTLSGSDAKEGQNIKGENLSAEAKKLMVQVKAQLTKLQVFSEDDFEIDLDNPGEVGIEDLRTILAAFTSITGDEFSD